MATGGSSFPTGSGITMLPEQKTNDAIESSHFRAKKKHREAPAWCSPVSSSPSSSGVFASDVVAFAAAFGFAAVVDALVTKATSSGQQE